MSKLEDNDNDNDNGNGNDNDNDKTFYLTIFTNISIIIYTGSFIVKCKLVTYLYVQGIWFTELDKDVDR
jgi:hypothetical protein